jgi:hypothetical protein
MKLQPIENVDGFRKDGNNGAVLSVDNRALYAYKSNRNKQHEVLNDISEIKNELRELRDLLNQVISLKVNERIL